MSHAKTVSFAALTAVAAAVVGCVTSTPVTPAPISPADAPKLQAAIVGSCQVTGTQKPGDEVKEAKGIHWTFSPDGKMHQHLETPFGTMDDDFAYHFDGRNLVNTGTYKVMRVDDWSNGTLKLFVYDLTQTYYCTRE